MNKINTKNKISSATKIKYSVGSKIKDFVVLDACPIKELQLVAYHMQHIHSKANFSYIDKDDKNNTFAVAFKTIPEDSTGIAHILEHIVLCGSKKYPIRDPFFGMIKRSLQNFMNAFTANDWTMYPFSTINKKDFYNLLDVYLDATFFPLLTEQSFFQEGWRFELEDNNNINSNFKAKGIVFNEMKGAMSNESEILSHNLVSKLLPDGTYSHNSGGEPSAILDLSWDNLKKFHKKYYQPSNAWFYYYGNLPLAEVIGFIDKKLSSQLKKYTSEHKIKLQKKWDKPQSYRFKYPTSDLKNSKHQVVVSWLLGDVTNLDNIMLLKVLVSVLINTAGSPLRKRLFDSKLGSGLSDLVGLNDDLRQVFFSIGLKGVESKNVKAVSDLIFKSLKEIVKEGIDKELVEATKHQIEFEIRELDRGEFSQGLKLLLGFVGQWLHGADMIYYLNFNKRIKKLNQQLKKPRVLEKLIKDKILNNKHCLTVELYPDTNYYQEQERIINNKIKRVEKSVNKSTRRNIQKQAVDLELIQNTKEDVDVLPQVKLSDIEVTQKGFNKNLIKKIKIGNNINSTLYHSATNGIAHIRIEFPIKNLLKSDYKYLPSLGILITKAGTNKTNYDKLVIKMSRYTGGIKMYPEIYQKITDKNSFQLKMVLSAKCLVTNIEKTVQMITEIINEYSFKDKSRIDNLLKQRSVELYNSILRNGHSYAGSVALKNINSISAIEEQFSGLTQVNTAIKYSNEKFHQELIDIYKPLASSILESKPEIVIVCPSESQNKILNSVEKLVENINVSKKVRGNNRISKPNLENEIWLTATPVSYVVKVFEVDSLLDENSQNLLVLTSLLRGEYLHKVIREQGGAYGAMTGYDWEKGLLLMLSYRDPNIYRTMMQFEKSLQWAAEGRFSQEELESAIIQTFSRLDKPLSSYQQAMLDFGRKNKGISTKFWNEFRKKIINVDRKSIIDYASNWKKLTKVTSAITSEQIWINESKNLNKKDYRINNI